MREASDWNTLMSVKPATGTAARKALLVGQLQKALLNVEQLLSVALAEHEKSRSELVRLDELLDELHAPGRAEESPIVTQQRQRRVVLAPHPSPLAETPMRTGETLPVGHMSVSSKWTSPTSSQCGKSARPSFTAAELQAARAESWAERMAAVAAA